MRRARSYSIVDHQLLHGGFFQRLSHEALALYLFLIVVGDRAGKSFYAERTIMGKLRLSTLIFSEALESLIQEGLVEYRRPNFWVRNLERQSRQSRPERKIIREETTALPARSTNPTQVKELLKNFFDQLEKKQHDPTKKQHEPTSKIPSKAF
jgi:hypothetical protein